MSKGYISAARRREVFERAAGCCEYCLMNANDRSNAPARLTGVHPIRGVTW